MRRTIIILTIAIVAILALVVATLVLVLTRPDPTYRTDDSAEAVAYNYALALTQQDYATAYAQLSPSLPGYPATEDDFTAAIASDYGFDQLVGAGIVLDPRVTTATRATIAIRLSTVQPGGLFDNGLTTRVSDLELTRVDGQWRITSGDYPLMPYCFTRPEGCQ